MKLRILFVAGLFALMMTMGASDAFAIWNQPGGTEGCEGPLNPPQTYQASCIGSPACLYDPDPAPATNQFRCATNGDTRINGSSYLYICREQAASPNLICEHYLFSSDYYTCSYFGNNVYRGSTFYNGSYLFANCTRSLVAPAVTLSASPTSIITGQSSTLTWTTPNAGTGFLVGDGLPMHRTNDGGATWAPQSVASASGYLTDVHFLNSNTGWAAGSLQISPETFRSGRIVKTVDGGATWTVQFTGAGTSDFRAVHFVDANTGWAAGGWGSGVHLRKTIDGGTTWTMLDTGITAWGYLNDVYFVDANTGWIAGGFAAGGPVLYKTTNGGLTWAPQNTGITEGLFALHFVNANTGWAAGQNGRILRTLDGGTTWTAQTSGTTQALNDIMFINASVGWVVGSGGTILRTTNGGTTWTVQTSGTTANLQDVQFLDTNTGWAVGTGGTILRTTNGGTTWAAQINGTQTYFAIQMLSLPVSCSAPWTTSTAPNGSQTVTPASTTSYTISCTNGVVTGTSNTVTITVSPPPDTTPPSVPTGVSALGVSPSQINVSWNFSSDGTGSGVAGYRIYRNGSATPIATVGAGFNAYSDTGLSPGTTYTYTISAYDVAGNPSAQSSPLASGTTLFSADTTDPSPPGSPQANAVSATQIALTWGASTDPTVTGETTSGLAGYRIWRNGSATPIATVGAGVTAYTDSGLAPSTAYTYFVSAFDNAGNESAQSGPASATTPALPTATISANPTSLTLGQSTTLTWSSTNATSCTASGSWSGPQTVSGTQTVTPATGGSYTYTLSCTGPGGTSSPASATVSVTVPPPPTVSLSASPTSLTLGQSTTLTWSSTNATSCTASGSWSGPQTVSGTQTITPATGGTYTYTLSCTGPGGGPTTQQVTVSVVPPAAPVVSLSASPTSLTLGQSTTLTWSSTNATSCSAAWTAGTGSSGTETVTPLVTTTYTISCTGPGGTVPQSTTVTVSDPPPVISGGQPSGVLAGGTTSVTLSVTTNEDAYCNYNQNTDVAFSSMSGSFTRDLARRTHTATISGLTDGTFYRYYVRCQDDPAGNENTSGYLIAFSVSTPPNVLPVAQFTTAPVSGQAPLTIAVDASGSADLDGTIVQYRWTWGDFSLPDTIGPVTAAQVYANPGSYTITLRVVDDQGGSSTATQTITVSSGTSPTPPPPTAGICIAACTTDAQCFGTDICGPSGFCIAAGSGGAGPVRNNGAATSLDGTIVSPPAASFPSNATGVTMSLTTDVNATCQYSNVAGTAYGASGMFQLSSTGLTNHSVTITGLGGLPTQTYSYTYYARCRDAQTGDVNTVDYPIAFSIGGATLSSGPNPYLCMVNESFVRNGLPYFFNVCQPRCETSTDCAAPTPTCDPVRRVCVR